MEVWLYGLGRNLARAYRTCAALGVERMVLLGGETCGLPVRSLRAEQTSSIPAALGLTVDAALAIALWKARARG